MTPEKLDAMEMRRRSFLGFPSERLATILADNGSLIKEVRRLHNIKGLCSIGNCTTEASVCVYHLEETVATKIKEGK